MPRLSELPAALLQPIVDRPSAETFLRALHAAGLDHHFDDGAVDCLYGNGHVSKADAHRIDRQVRLCYAAWEASGADLWHDCPIGFMLTLMDAAGELPAGALDPAE